MLFVSLSVSDFKPCDRHIKYTFSTAFCLFTWFRSQSLAASRSRSSQLNFSFSQSITYYICISYTGVYMNLYKQFLYTCTMCCANEQWTYIKPYLWGFFFGNFFVVFFAAAAVCYCCWFLLFVVHFNSRLYLAGMIVYQPNASIYTTFYNAYTQTLCKRKRAHENWRARKSASKRRSHLIWPWEYLNTTEWMNFITFGGGGVFVICCCYCHHRRHCCRRRRRRRCCIRRRWRCWCFVFIVYMLFAQNFFPFHLLNLSFSPLCFCSVIVEFLCIWQPNKTLIARFREWVRTKKWFSEYFCLFCVAFSPSST